MQLSTTIIKTTTIVANVLAFVGTSPNTSAKTIAPISTIKIAENKESKNFLIFFPLSFSPNKSWENELKFLVTISIILLYGKKSKTFT